MAFQNYQYPGVSGRFAGGITNPSQNRMLSSGAGLMKPNAGALRPTGRMAPVVGPRAPFDAATPKNYGRGLWGGPQGPQSITKDLSGGGVHSSMGLKDWAKPDFYDFQAGPERPTMAGAGYVGGRFTGADYTDYNPELWTDQPDVDTRAIVDASRHFYEDDMAQRMGEASRRFGASGAIRSSGHREGLEDAERKMFSDINALGMKYDYDAAQQDASRSLSAFSDYEARRAQEAARATGFSQSEAARRTGYDTGEAGRRTNFNVGQQDRTNQFNWQDYGADLSERERRQMYDMLKMKYGG